MVLAADASSDMQPAKCSGPRTTEPCEEGWARVKVEALDLHKHIALAPSLGRLAHLQVLLRHDLVRQ